MVDNMNRHTFLLLTTILSLSILTACGGVASNPTAPTFNPPGGQSSDQGPAGETGIPPEIQGQMSGGGAQMGENIIEGDYDTLWAQGIEAMERGHSVPAAQFFMSALAQDPQSANAALAYAITDVMRDHRMYSIFLHPGVDKLFMNTQLIGMPEAFPNPFLAEDSYFLRLAALGNRTGKLNPGVSFPIIAPVDTAMMFTPENYMSFTEQQMHNEGPPAGTPPPVRTETGENGNTQVPPDGGTNTPPPPPEQGQDMGISKEMPDQQKQGGADMLGGGGDNGGGGGGGGGGSDPAGGEGDPGDIRGTGGFGGPMAPAPAILPERELPVSEDEWDALIREYRESASRDGADIFLSVNFYSNLVRFHGGIAEHINNLERVRSLVEEEGYSLALPFNVLDGTQKVTMTFDMDDFNLIVDYFRMLDVLLSYIEAYNYDVSYLLPTEEINDRNGDSVLSPDEYLPAPPFGTLSREGLDTLGNLLPTLLGTLVGLDDDMQPLIDEASQVQAGDIERKEIFYLSSFHRNFTLISDWTELLRDIADKSTSGTAIKLAGGSGVIEEVVVYDALFNNPVEDIREYLPSFDAVTGVAIRDDENNWISDPTFAGFFQEGIDNPQVYQSAGRLHAIVYDESMAKAAGYTVSVAGSNGQVNEAGLATINNITLNDLAGTPFTVSDDSGAEVGSGSLRNHYVLVPLFDVDAIAILFSPTGPMGSPEESGEIYTPRPGQEQPVVEEEGDEGAGEEPEVGAEEEPEEPEAEPDEETGEGDEGAEEGDEGAEGEEDDGGDESGEEPEVPEDEAPEEDDNQGGETGNE